MLEEGDGRQLEKKIDAFGRNLANYHHGCSWACYSAIWISGWIPSWTQPKKANGPRYSCVAAYSAAFWCGMGAALERWF